MLQYLEMQRVMWCMRMRDVLTYHMANSRMISYQVGGHRYWVGGDRRSACSLSHPALIDASDFSPHSCVQAIASHSWKLPLGDWHAASSSWPYY